MSRAATDAAPAFAAAIATRPEPDAKSSTRLPAHDARTVEDVARQRLPAGPGERPEGRRQADGAEFLLGLLPQGGRLVGKVETDLRRVRNRQEARMGGDEGGRVGDRLHAASASMPA